MHDLMHARAQADRTGELSVIADALPAEVWRGHVKAWQCDEMGHQNATFYLTQALEGEAVARAVLAEHGIDAPGAARAHHIRFLRELHAGTAVHLRAGLARAGDEHALLLALVNSENYLVSALVSARLGTTIDAPAPSLDCAFEPDKVFTAIPYGPQHAPSLGVLTDLPVTARGMFLPAESDRGAGEVRQDALFGRVTDATHYYSRLFERVAMAHDEPGSRLGTAAVECRFDYLRLPVVGERFTVRTALTELGSKSRRVAHFVIAVERGDVVCAVHTLELNFDLAARRARAAPASALAELAPQLRAGLAPTDLGRAP